MGLGRLVRHGLHDVGVLGLIVAVIVMVFRSWGHRPEGTSAAGTSSEDDALRVLDTRFARGEIDAEEYTSRRDLLRKR